MIFSLNVSTCHDIRHFRGKFALPADMTQPTFAAKLITGLIADAFPSTYIVGSHFGFNAGAFE